MNKHMPKPRSTPYEADYAQWCAEQGALLREGRLSDLDRENLAEEIESLGRSDRREIESRLKVLILHLLKLRFQPERQTPGWQSTLREQRFRIGRILKESPSLRRYPQDVLNEEYALARFEAAEETGLPEETFPKTCPFTIEEILDAAFLPMAD